MYSNEKQRVYYYPSLNNQQEIVLLPVTLRNILSFSVNEFGVHRIKTKDERIHLLPTGWLHLEIEEPVLQYPLAFLDEVERTYFYPVPLSELPLLYPLKFTKVIQWGEGEGEGVHYLKTADGKLHLVPNNFIHLELVYKSFNG